MNRRREGMRFELLATDYDGTLATRGRVDDETLASLSRWRAAGGALVLVTGRVLDDLAKVFPRLDLFDAVVAENGGVLRLGDAPPRLLCPPVDARLVLALAAEGVQVGVGLAVIGIDTVEVLRAVQLLSRLGLEHEIALNRGAAMILPRGVDKGSGLVAALAALGRDPARAVAIGDAENDLAMFAAVGAAVAVANAIPALAAAARWTTHGRESEGVREAIARLLAGEAPG